MNDLWNTLLQWLHRVGLHPDRAEVERAGAAVLDSATGVAHTVGQAASGMDMASLLALAAALGWASGFRLYLVVFLVGMLGATGLMELPGGLHVLEHPALLFASGGMLCMEFFADKIPGVDSLWDLLQSVLRVPEGATVLARSAQDAAHAFRWGDAVWGLQFHPEFSTGHMRGYIHARSEALANEGRCGKRLAREVSAAPQARQVLRRFVRHARGSRAG